LGLLRTPTHTRARARARAHTHTHTQTHARRHTHTHTDTHTHTHTHTHTRVCACVCVLHACQGVFFACVGAVLFLLPTIVDRSNGRAKHSLTQLPCLAIAGSPQLNSKVSCAPEWLRC
jgi:ABC-type Zn2+ transport system substrate-binding protein/surface adhesin